MSIYAIFTLLISGCASLAPRELFPEINARRAPSIETSEIIDLLPGPVEASAILMRANGTAAVIAVDSSHRLHYVAAANHGTVTREILGVIESGDCPRVDIIEHRGQLRVLAGDKQFSRGVAAAAWKEAGGWTLLGGDHLPDETFTWFIEDRFAVMVTCAVGSALALLEICSTVSGNRLAA